VEKWCRWSVKRVVCEIVETVAEEMSRLLLCVGTAFSSNGATLDILLLKHALALYTSAEYAFFIYLSSTGVTLTIYLTKWILKMALDGTYSK
jgi:hypothetical protein